MARKQKDKAMSKKTGSQGKGRSKPRQKGDPQVQTDQTAAAVGFKDKGGRPTKYSEEVLQEICDRLSKGEPLAQICREEAMPSMTTVWNWQNINPDKELGAKVSEAIARAREEGEEVIAVDCLNIADDNGKDTRFLDDGREVTDADVVQRAKLRIDTRLKLLAKWNPKKWGEKVDMTSNGKTIATPTVVFQSNPDA